MLGLLKVSVMTHQTVCVWDPLGKLSLTSCPPGCDQLYRLLHGPSLLGVGYPVVCKTWFIELKHRLRKPHMQWLWKSRNALDWRDCIFRGHCKSYAEPGYKLLAGRLCCTRWPLKVYQLQLVTMYYDVIHGVDVLLLRLSCKYIYLGHPNKFCRYANLSSIKQRVACLRNKK